MVFLLTHVRLIDIPVLYKPSSMALAPTNEITGSVVSRAPGLVRFRFVFQVACVTNRSQQKKGYCHMSLFIGYRRELCITGNILF